MSDYRLSLDDLKELRTNNDEEELVNNYEQNRSENYGAEYTNNYEQNRMPGYGMEYEAGYEQKQRGNYGAEYVNAYRQRRVNMRSRNQVQVMDMIVTLIFVGANLIAFLLAKLAGTDNFYTGGINSDHVIENGEFIRVFSYMFLHANFEHLFNNMLALVLFGMAVENRVGSYKMFLIYSLSGVLGGIFSMYAHGIAYGERTFYVIGSSGAVFGLLGAYFVIKYRNDTGGDLKSIGMAAVYVILYALISVSSGGTGVDTLGHLGGGFVGIITAFIMTSGDRRYELENSSKKLLGIVLALVFSFVAICGAGIGKDVKQLRDSKVDFIKSQDFAGMPGRTYEEVLGQYRDATWEGFYGKNNDAVVEFNGKKYVAGAYEEIMIQFIVDEDKNTYQIGYASKNGIAMSQEDFIRFCERELR